MREDVAALDLGVRQDRDRRGDRAAHDLAQEDAARAGQLGQLGERLAVDLLAGHVDVDALDRHVQQLGVVDLLGAPRRSPSRAPRARRPPRPRRPRAARCRRSRPRSCRRGARAGRRRARRAPAPRPRRPAGRRPCRPARTRKARTSQRCQAEPAPPISLRRRRRASPRSPCTAATRSMREQLRAEHGDHDRRADGAEHVGHRVRDRHRVEHGLGLRRRGMPEPVDGVGREAHRGGDRLRARVEARRVAEVVADELGDHDGDHQAEHALDHREERLRQAVLGDAAHELRPDAVADGEQEHAGRRSP